MKCKRASHPIAFLLACASLISCSTVKPKSAEEQLKDKPFRAEALSSVIFVEHKGKSYRVKGEISILDDNAIRMDVFTGLDLPLASLILTSNKVEYVLYRDRKHYRGLPNPHALDKLFPLAVEAKNLVRILQEQKTEGDQCASDAKDPDSITCRNKVGDVEYQVTWTQHQDSGLWSGRAKKMILEIPSKDSKVKFHYSDVRPLPDNKEALSTLKVPAGFKTYSVPTK